VTIYLRLSLVLIWVLFYSGVWGIYPAIFLIMEENKNFGDNIRPSTLIKGFRSDWEFIAWAMQGTARDLKACIREFASDGLYWHCEEMDNIIIRQN
jgi:hypothetical protein